MATPKERSEKGRLGEYQKGMELWRRKQRLKSRRGRKGAVREQGRELSLEDRLSKERIREVR